MEVNPGMQPEAATQGIVHWTEQHYGGRVIRVEQIRRWRPIWRVDVDLAGVIKSLAFKGPRDGNVIPYPVEHEFHLLRLLEANGIPVPHAHGVCERPKAVVMDWMPGGRDPGMVMMAAEAASGMSKERWQASLEYMDRLADMHRIDPTVFLSAGLTMPDGAEAIALNGFERFYDLGQEKGIVNPFMDFCSAWLHRNVPTRRNRISFVTGDCCQFLSDRDKVTTLLDMEIGYLGDPLSDLACFLGRHPVENLGDIPALFDRYAQAMGEPIDTDALAYQTVVFMSIAFYFPVLTLPVAVPGGDWVESQTQVAFCGRRCAEAMAGAIGIALDDTVELPEAAFNPLEELALEKVAQEITHMPTTAWFQEWKRDIVEKIPHWLKNQLRYGGWAEQENLNDVAEILGYRPENQTAADNALSSFVLNAGAEHDARLIRYFYRRNLRDCHICVGSGAPKDHIIFAKLQQIADFGKA